MSMLSKLKQFKDLRSKAKTMQSALSEEKVTETAMGGKIKLTMNGNMEIVDLTIDDSIFTSHNKKDLENGLKVLFENAIKKIQRIMAAKMKEMGGFDLPGAK